MDIALNKVACKKLDENHLFFNMIKRLFDRLLSLNSLQCPYMVNLTTERQSFNPQDDYGSR